MRDRIQEYLDGKFISGCPEIGLSPKAVNAYAGEGPVFSGSFFLESITGEELEAYVFCDELHTELPKQRFAGTYLEIPYKISVEGLQDEDVVCGEFDIVTNYGEYRLPYTITVGKEPEKSEEKSIKNLFHFANLAREEWERAAVFFKKKEFLNLLVNNDRQYRNLYYALTKEGADEQAMDEFLTAVHKKERVSFWLDRTEGFIPSAHIKEEQTLVIHKESWGYIEAEVICDRNAFIKLSKSRLSKDDFVGNVCTLSYSVLTEQLHPGLNRETILIRTPFQEMEYHITAECTETDQLWQLENKMLNSRIQFWQLYLSFRKKEISSGFWVQQSLSLVEKILDNDSENAEWKLIKIQLLLLGKKETEGKILLTAFDKGKNLKETDRVLYAYYMYLCACYKKEKKQTKKAADELWNIYRSENSPFPVLWMLFYLDEELRDNLQRKWNLLKEQHRMGCASPMLYAEALLLLKKDENLLQQLGSFEVHLLLFAKKHGLFRNRWLDRILSLSVKNNRYHPLLFKLYKGCYQMAPGKEWLTVLVSILVRSGETKEEYQEWYELAVRQNLNIAGIFERFTDHLKYREEKKLPRSVVEYYSRSLEELRENQKTELLYLMEKFGTSGAMKKNDSYDRYKKLVHFFLKDQLLKGKINEKMAYLYNAEVDEDILQDEKALERFGEMLFLKQIKSKWKNIRKVLVVNEKLSGVKEYPFENNRAVVPVYSDEDVIVLVDERGRRYGLSSDYSVEEMIDYRRFASFFEEDVDLPFGMLIHTEIGGQKYLNISPENQYYLELLVKDGRLEKEFKNRLFMALLEYYQNSFQNKKLQSVLEEVHPKEYSPLERGKLLEMLLGEGMYGQAYPVITACGYDYVDYRLLVGMLNDRILDHNFEEDEKLTGLCHQVVKKGKYTDNMLEYLARYYDGELTSLKEIWDLAHNFGLDSSGLAERILNRIVFMGGSSKDYYEVFLDYTNQNGYDGLACAYLALESYCCFVKDKRNCEAVNKILGQLLAKGQKLPWICKLAFMKCSAAKEELNEKEKQLLEIYMKEAIRKKQVYPFFKKLERLLDKDYGFENQVIIEYRTRPGSRVWLHYLLETDKNGEEKYITEMLENDFEGIYTKSFTLFFGEKLQYYITEGTADNRHFKENKTFCGGSENFFHRERRLQMLNDMLVSAGNEDKKELFRLMDQYVSMDYLTERLFHRL